MKAIFLLADGFEEIEFTVPYDVLNRLGVETVPAGIKSLSVTGSHGLEISAECLLFACAAEEFDAVILPGGLPGATNLRDSKLVLEFIRKAATSGKIVAAICAAPLVLNAAGLLQGRRFAAFPAEKLYPEYGSAPSGNPVETDGNIVTAHGAGASFAFARAIAEALGKKSELEALYQNMLVK